ncbi:MAG TPA: hypothetical protein PKX48_13495 [Planctomycetota bacterium]|jgi:lipoate-protein ligase A|nr:hypothetical protein [Planctomycetota bacterium]OQC21912.1 MAG: putative lipoate-protein ligase A [Planctomycetes bacterium ADurb.Bin069]HNS00010.1 hypothetical protein [Planctomycetota bacterium]HNU27032.1 hypothetical protein [Planctomycetota bacterium]HOE29597.1 hypothetical protein [Planctomycetota bacterium]
MAELGAGDVAAAVFVEPRAETAAALGTVEGLLAAARAEGHEVAAYLWRPRARGVVLGSACRLGGEVHRDECRRRALGVFRRASGGGTVLIGPETWCYSCVLSRGIDPGSIQGAFAWLHRVVIAALGRFGVAAESVAVSDLAARAPGGELRKLAGHSQKRTRRGVLCEGTLLAEAFPFPMSAVLRHPPREPEYRRGRPHEEFVTDLRALGAAVEFQEFAAAFAAALGAAPPRELPAEFAARGEALARERYLAPEWTERL